MAYLGRGLDKISNIEVLDNITFDGSSSYSITKNSVAFTPNSAQSLLISIDGVVQATNFTVSSSTIDFGVAIPSTSVCNFFLHYGTGVITVPSDGSVTTAKLGDDAVTGAKLSKPFNYDNGTFYLDDTNNRVGIGTTSPSNILDIVSSTQYKGLEISNGSNIIAELIGFGSGNDGGGLKLRNSGTATVEIQASGNSFLNGGKVGIGTSSPLGGGNALTVKRNSGTYNPTDSGYAAYVHHASNSSGANGLLVSNYWQATTSKLISAISVNAANGSEVTRFEVNGVGDTSISGALSKGSGSFKIDHPLPSKTETHNLVHSFVEAPQADNIYRGKIDLVNGTATVNIDTVAGMTEGTFVLLNTNIQCFTTNETGWTAVKGSVSGNILTITAQDNTCTDTISWMVIGERQDQHMIDTSWTDENGKVIVEPLKE